MDNLVSKVRLRSKETSKQIIHQEFQDWVEDMRFTRSQDTKVLRAMEIYWLAKTLVSLSMDDKEYKQVETLEKTRRLKAKFAFLCQVAFRINFKVQDCDPDNNDELVRCDRYLRFSRYQCQPNS